MGFSIMTDPVPEPSVSLMFGIGVLLLVPVVAEKNPRRK